MSIVLETKDGKKISLLDHNGLWIRLSVKMEELNSLFKSLSRDNMYKAKVSIDNQLSYEFGYVDLESCTLEFGSQLIASLVFKEISVSEIELSAAREKAEAMRNVFLIGMNHAAPEDVVRWCNELDSWRDSKYPYKKGERFKYNGKPYEVIMNLVTDPYQTPDKQKALYKEITKENKPVYPEWTNGIVAKKGERYIYAGDIWENTWDDNYRAPGGLGWKKV